MMTFEEKEIHMMDITKAMTACRVSSHEGASVTFVFIITIVPMSQPGMTHMKPMYNFMFT